MSDWSAVWSRSAVAVVGGVVLARGIDQSTDMYVSELTVKAAGLGRTLTTG